MWGFNAGKRGCRDPADHVVACAIDNYQEATDKHAAHLTHPAVAKRLDFSFASGVDLCILLYLVEVSDPTARLSNASIELAIVLDTDMTIDTGTGRIPYPVPIGAYMHDMDPPTWYVPSVHHQV